MGEPTRGAAGALSGIGTSASIAPLPKLDLCVMNRPFVRSVNSNLLFGSMPRLVAVRVNEMALSNVWYPLRLMTPSIRANSTRALTKFDLGIWLLAGHRVPTQGAWVQFKKPTWNPMPVLDVLSLDSARLETMSNVFDRTSGETLNLCPKWPTTMLEKRSTPQFRWRLDFHRLHLCVLCWPRNRSFAITPLVNVAQLWMKKYWPIRTLVS